MRDDIAKNYFAIATVLALTFAFTLAETVLFSSLGSNIDWLQSATANLFGIAAGIYLVVGVGNDIKMASIFWALLSCVVAASFGLAALASLFAGMVFVVTLFAAFVFAIIAYEDATRLVSPWTPHRDRPKPPFPILNLD